MTPTALRPRLTSLVAVAVAAVLLAGCATAAPPGSPGSSAPEETPAPEYTALPLLPPTAPEVLAYCPVEPAGHLAIAAAEVVEVHRCGVRFGADGATGTETVERLVDDPADLLAAYAVADAERPDDVMCTMDLADPLILWLELTTGDIVPVRAPTDECGKPQPDAQAAVESAAFETVLEIPLP